jgi:hypothetical protein
MTTWTTSDSDSRYEADDSWDQDRFEKITRRRQGEWGVRSDTAQTRARMRSRGTAAARLKARTFNGVNRRGRSSRFAPSFYALDATAGPPQRIRRGDLARQCYGVSATGSAGNSTH